MSVYISPVAEGATPGIGNWLEIRNSGRYDDQTLYTRSAAWPEPRYIERVGSLLLILSDSGKSHAGRLLLLAPAQQARSIANMRAITLSGD